MPQRTSYLPGVEDQPRQITVTLPAREYAALAYFRDTCFPGQSYELMARKLIQDELIRAGVLNLTPDNRGKAAGK